GKSALGRSRQCHIDVRAYSESSTIAVQIDTPFPAQELPPAKADHRIPNAGLAAGGRITFNVGGDLKCHPPYTTLQRQIGDNFVSRQGVSIENVEIEAGVRI